MDPIKPRKKPKIKPTIRQIKALQYINMGMSKRKAMIKAGYSHNVADEPTKKLINTPGVQLLLESMRNELVDQDLTVKYAAKKMKEWFEAKKTHSSHTEPDREVPDYDVQLKAYDRWAKIVNVGTEPSQGKVKRQMTVTEFVLGNESEAIEGEVS